jgi:hypothetical protein
MTIPLSTFLPRQVLKKTGAIPSKPAVSVLICKTDGTGIDRPVDAKVGIIPGPARNPERIIP